MIRFHTLGTLELRAADGRALLSVLAQPKRTALLAYIAVASPRGYHRRDTLLGLFWPESQSERARHSLNQAVYALRSTLGKDVLVSRGGEEIGLAPEALWCDAAALEEALEVGKLEEALELYRGDLLPGFFLSEAPEFERWLESERLRLRDRVVEAAWRLAEREETAGNTVGAAHRARHAAALAPDDEPALRRLIALLDRLGDRAGALSAYDAFARRLAEEYGAEPAAETRGLIEEMHSAPGAAPLISPPPVPEPPAARPPLRPSPPAERHELPVPSTPFLGRQAELAAVRDLLEDPGCRLVTLIGPGGTGKTRLALQAGSELRARFAEGVRFVPLAPVHSAELLPSTLAETLDLSLAGERDLEKQILESLAGREILLILDNFDHLVEAAGFVARLLERAPRVKLLVTSREALNVRGESLCSLQGMSFPGDVSTADPESYDAVHLFLQTARRAQPGLTLADKDRVWVARICRLVEGLPLAIELAAAWLRVLSCEELCREIERSYAFLAAPRRDVPERHRSLRAAFASSWYHLTDEERTAFRRLAVFRGGFCREAAAAVAGATAPLLLTLLDKSLLRRLPSGRFEMLEVLRHFAEEQLEPESEAVRDRHCAYYARFLGEREAALEGARQDEALTEIGEEIANLRQAWHRAVERARDGEIARALESLFVFYDIRGWHQEAAELFALAVRGLEQRCGHDRDETTARTLSRLLARQGVFCLRLGEHEQAYELLEDSLALSRPLTDRREIAFSLDRLGVVCYNLGRFTEARHCQAESLAIRRALGDTHGIATSLNNLGSLAYALGDYPEARRLCAESLAIQRQLGDRGGVAISLQNLGYISLLLGEEREAKRLLEETLAVARESGSGLLLARALHNLGNLANALGEFGEARSYFEQALAAAFACGATPVALDALVGLSVLLSRLDDKERALELLASALQHPAAERESRQAAEQLLVDLKSELSPDAVETALTRARARTLEELLEDLRAAPDPVRA
jgi:predicted ATPase/DNA-binding SARP family transcriptional activator